MRQYQVVQRRRDLVELRIVPQDPALAARAREIEGLYSSFREKGVAVEAKFVERIEPRSSGKFELYVPLDRPTK